ncbi:MAG TPA: DUF4013 domain-containing protein [Candidatus Dormibacteraeota bacterium]
MRAVADSFGWAARADRATWALGVLAVLFLPLLFIPLFGYAIAAVRAAEVDPKRPPPRWDLSGRLLSDGLWTSLLVLLTALPFALLWNPIGQVLAGGLGDFKAHVIAALLLLLPWGLILLLYVPFNAAEFAASGRPRDLFDSNRAWRRAREDFVTWNAVVSAIVTSWAIGIACVGLLCVGVVPGIFYAILVSAHAAAALHRPGQDPGPSTR